MPLLPGFDPVALWAILERSERLLIPLPVSASLDEAMSALTWQQFLKNLHKEADLLLTGPLPPLLARHKEHARFEEPPKPMRAFAIEVDIKKTGILDLSYHHNKERLTVHITPKTGLWRAEDVRFTSSSYAYDTLLCLGVTAREELGTLWTEYRDALFQIPLVNLDYRPTNSLYTPLSFVSRTHTSLSELTLAFLEKISPETLTPEISTWLLTGVTHATGRFGRPDLQPAALEAAGNLLARGAKRDDVVDQLTRHHSVSTLRLWGRMLSRLKSDSASGVVWTCLLKRDLEGVDVREILSSRVFEELLLSSPESTTSLILLEEAEGRFVAIASGEQKTFLLTELKKEAGHLFDLEAVLLSATSLVEAEEALQGALQRLSRSSQGAHG